jgi:Protein of unknown function (DUF3307)
MNLIWLLFAHFIGDWALQSNWMGQNKSKRWIIMFAHCMIYTGVIAIALQYLGILEYWKLAFIFLGHYIMDFVKGKAAHSEKDWRMIYLDHMWHLSQLVIVCLFK